MSRNGSGTYTLPAGNPVVTGTTISTTWANNTLNDIAASLTDSVAADGQTPMTGNLDLNTNKIENLADGTLPTDAVNLGQLGTMAVQDADAVAITGGTISGTVITSRVVAIANGTSVTINAAVTDIATQANTQAVGTLTINAPTGAPVNGQKLIFRLTSTNVQTFSWNAIFAGSSDLVLPATSSGSSLTDYVGFIYNSTASKWQLVAKVFGF